MPRKSFRIACAAALLLAVLIAGSEGASATARVETSAQTAAGPVARIGAQLKSDGDRADPALIRELADLRTRAALDALLELRSTFASIVLRREIVRSLARFDGVPDAGRAAVDTVVVTSERGPTSGRLVEPAAIREAVERRNASRGVEIDTIAIRGKFQILEWLAEDSGGTHLRLE